MVNARLAIVRLKQCERGAGDFPRFRTSIPVLGTLDEQLDKSCFSSSESSDQSNAVGWIQKIDKRCRDRS